MKLIKIFTKTKKTFGLFMLKMMFYVLLSIKLDIVEQWKKSLEFR